MRALETQMDLASTQIHNDPHASQTMVDFRSLVDEVRNRPAPHPHGAYLEAVRDLLRAQANLLRIYRNVVVQNTVAKAASNQAKQKFLDKYE
jgi:hypothetical protein